MKAAYWDTSCVLALYVPEKISAQAAGLAAMVKGQMHSSSILEFEMTFAVHAKEARGEIPSGSSAKVLSQFQTDLQRGRFLLVPLGIDIKASTKDIAARTRKAEPPFFLRTLDGIHIATVLKLGSSELITADRKMADAATRLGIKTKFHSHPIEEKIDPEGEMDGVFETCHLAGYEKTKTPPSIGCKVQRFPAALQLDSLPSGIQVG